MDTLTLHEYLDDLAKSRRNVANPGSRGGDYYVDRAGWVRYGPRPGQFARVYRAPGRQKGIVVGLGHGPLWRITSHWGQRTPFDGDAATLRPAKDQAEARDLLRQHGVPIHGGPRAGAGRKPTPQPALSEEAQAHKKWWDGFHW
jgi:hypothetical protein